MNNWLQQIQSVLAKKSGDGKSCGGLSEMLAPGALGGLAGLLVASKSSRKLLTKYGGKALIIGGGAAAGAVLWNKYKQRVRETHQDEPGFGELQTPVDQRAERLVTALVFAAKSDGHIDDRERATIEQNIHQACYGQDAEKLISRPCSGRWTPNGWRRMLKMKKKHWNSIFSAVPPLMLIILWSAATCRHWATR